MFSLKDFLLIILVMLKNKNLKMKISSIVLFNQIQVNHLILIEHKKKHFFLVDENDAEDIEKIIDEETPTKVRENKFFSC